MLAVPVLSMFVSSDNSRIYAVSSNSQSESESVAFSATSINLLTAGISEGHSLDGKKWWSHTFNQSGSYLIIITNNGGNPIETVQIDGVTKPSVPAYGNRTYTGVSSGSLFVSVQSENTMSAVLGITIY